MIVIYGQYRSRILILILNYLKERRTEKKRISSIKKIYFSLYHFLVYMQFFILVYMQLNILSLWQNIQQ